MPSPRRRVLIVDDDDSTVEVLKRFLITKGFDTAEAKDGQSAMELARRFRPDLILLDVMMPDLSGDVVCKALKTNPETSWIPVIMTTAKREREDLINGLDVGADDYVRKPFDVYELLARIKAHLRVRDLYREMEAAQLATLLDFLRSVSGVTSPAQLLDAILARLAGVVDLAHGALVLVDPADVAHGVVVAATADGPLTPGRVELAAVPEVARAVGTRQLQVVPAVSAPAGGGHSPEKGGAGGAAVAIPIAHQDQLVAVLRLRTSTDRGLGERDLRLCELLTNAAAAALQAARAFESGRAEHDLYLELTRKAAERQHR